jgi:hypothetical protein
MSKLAAEPGGDESIFVNVVARPAYEAMVLEASLLILDVLTVEARLIADVPTPTAIAPRAKNNLRTMRGYNRG